MISRFKEYVACIDYIRDELCETLIIFSYNNAFYLQNVFLEIIF